MKQLRLTVLAGCLGLVACSGGGGHPSTAPSASPSVPSPTASASATASTTGDKTVWLCRPGGAADPCDAGLASTDVLADGTHRQVAAPHPARTDLDCFYVYPTVSRQPTANADLTIEAPERAAAIAQASRFSTACRVWAPMYRQRTVGDLLNPQHGLADSPQNLLAVASLRTAWRDYLAHDNGGRPVVFIGHSQGAAMLIRLLATDVDPDPKARSRMALAILLGGNVTVADGAAVGGSFRHLPLCSRKGQRGCVIAYSSFPAEPPSFAFFGRAGMGVSLMAGEIDTHRQVACVDPAAIGGGAALLHPYFPRANVPQVRVTTPWVSFPGLYRAQCRHAGSATWLQVTAVGGAGDRRPLIPQSLGPTWGYHVADVNLALGDLVGDVLAVARHR